MSRHVVLLIRKELAYNQRPKQLSSEYQIVQLV